MKSIESVRSHLYKAIERGHSKEVILSISRELDTLIVKQMLTQNQQHMKRRVS